MSRNYKYICISLVCAMLGATFPATGHTEETPFIPQQVDLGLNSSSGWFACTAPRIGESAYEACVQAHRMCIESVTDALMMGHYNYCATVTGHFRGRNGDEGSVTLRCEHITWYEQNDCAAYR